GCTVEARHCMPQLRDNCVARQPPGALAERSGSERWPNVAAVMCVVTDGHLVRQWP
ncbi:MAG: hypothetical protein QOI89_3652, partial [Solirubrobacteraceae bacterium]|nr:hypothetical protein [Solirubrobacteraceae bacterium]